MISVKPQSNTQIIELDVTNKDPQLAAQLANDVGQSLAQYSNTKLNATVEVLPAIAPSDPIQPKPSLDALLGALVGFGLALALIVVFEWTDDRIANPEEIQELLSVDILTIIPQLSRKQRVKNAEEIPALAEGCRILAANINAARLSKPFKLIMVTSALGGEGKSTIAANLASFLATSGKQVLLVDADLRHPVLDQHFQLDNRQGLSNVFLEIWARIHVELSGQPTEIPSLRVLTAGVTPSNAVELLQSQLAGQVFEHFKKLPFDYIIFDTSPLLPTADTRILASYMDAAVLIVDVSKTPSKILVRAMQILRRSSTIQLGVIVNKSQWPDYGGIRDYLTDIQQQKPKADMALSIPPVTPLEHASASGTSNKQRAKVASSTPMSPNMPSNSPLATEGLNEQKLDGEGTMTLSSRIPRPESASNEQRSNANNKASPALNPSHSNAVHEHNREKLKKETVKLPAVKPSRANDIPDDASITAPLPQP
jgi:capsular exopolysaccharide synthesis family protein